MKAMKKVFAMLLALAMIVTAVPVSSASAATYNMKAGSITKTLYAGRSHTLKLSGLTASKVKSTSWSVGKTSVVKLSSKKATSAKMTCVGKGYTVVTAKVTLTNKKTKTYKAKITVKNPSLKVTPSGAGDANKLELTIGGTAQLDVSYKPTNAKVTYASRDKGIASVSGTKVTATGAGETVITTTLVCGTKKVTKETTVVVKALDDGLTPILTNPIAGGYDNTILVNQKAVINVQYVRDGKPVSGETLVMTIDKNKSGGTATAVGHYKVAFAQAQTNANGVASFVIENDQNNVKSYSKNEIANIVYTVYAPTSAVSKTSSVAFAAVYLTSVNDVNNHNNPKEDNLAPGENFSGGSADADIYTASMDNPTYPINEYVMSQMVSSAGSSEHAVTFKGGYPVIAFPGTAADATAATKKVDPVNYDSADYHVYNDAGNDDTTLYYTLTENPNKLTYATMNFKDIKISAHTQLVIETYKNEADAKNPGVAPIDNYTIDGPSSQSAFSYQIKLDTRYSGLCVKVYIKSEGQVDLDMNAGYKVSDVVYVFKTSQGGSGAVNAPLKDATVEWEIVATPYTNEEVVLTASGTKYGYAFTVANGGKLTAKLPAFPYTGTAILTLYDGTGKITNYYAVETSNNGWNKNVIGENSFDDDGVIDNTVYHVYEIAEDELRDKVGEITAQDGTTVTVNSEKSGRTTLEGTVKVNGETLAGLDAETNAVYTSVQWNPIPNVGGGRSAEGFVALLGQKIEVIAQLTDKNGNAVTKAGETVTFSAKGDADITSTDLTVPSVKLANGSAGTVTVVDVVNSTDKNGQAKLILKTNDPMVVTELTADTKGSYNVKLIIKDKNPKEADLYWIDADITFTSHVGGTEVKTSAATPSKNVDRNTVGVRGLVPKSGENWEYGVKATGTFIPNADKYGELKNKTISVSGLDLQMAAVAGSVGTVTILRDNRYTSNFNSAAQVTSSKTGMTNLLSRISEKSVTEQTTVSAGTFAGIGDTTISKKMNLEIAWSYNGMSTRWVAPTGTRVLWNNATVTTMGGIVVNAYLMVTDTNGNPVSNTTVKFTTDTEKVNLCGVGFPTTVTTAAAVDATVYSKYAEVTTNQYGIAAVGIVNDASQVRVTLIATVDGITGDAFEETFTWVDATTAGVETLAIDATKDPVTGKYKSYFDMASKCIVLTFTDDILPECVSADMFKAAYHIDSDDKYGFAATETGINFIIDSMTVSGKVVMLHVSNPPATLDAKGVISVEVKADHATIDGVVHNLVTEANGAGYNGAETIFFCVNQTTFTPAEKTGAVSGTDTTSITW